MLTSAINVMLLIIVLLYIQAGLELFFVYVQMENSGAVHMLKNNKTSGKFPSLFFK